MLASCALVLAGGTVAPVAGGDPRVAFGIDDPPEARHRLLGNLRAGLGVDFKSEFDRRHDPDTGERIVRWVGEPAIQLALSYARDGGDRIGLRAFADLELKRRQVIRDDAGSATGLDLTELWALASLGRSGVSLQVGRQRFEDERQWWFDEHLDAVRAYVRTPRVGLEMAAGRFPNLDDDEGEPDVHAYLLVGRYAIDEEIDAEAYLVGLRDRGARSRTRLYGGLRSIGDVGGGWSHWLDAAVLLGRQGDVRLRGLALDAGLTWRRDGRWSPNGTLAVAFGSGDGDPGDGVDHAFVQTGFQENESELEGVAAFAYYGEVLKPELSNLLVLTGAVGIGAQDRWSIDLLYHHYFQHRPSVVAGELDLESVPNGRSHRLGHALELVLGWRARTRLELGLALGVFFPGPAFDATVGNAVSGRLEVAWRY